MMAFPTSQRLALEDAPPSSKFMDHGNQEVLSRVALEPTRIKWWRWRAVEPHRVVYMADPSQHGSVRSRSPEITLLLAGCPSCRRTC
jgi:hypothetical protein